MAHKITQTRLDIELKLIKFLLILLTALLLSSCADSIPFPVTSAEKKAFVTTQIDYHLGCYQSPTQAGVSLLFLKDDEVVYKRSVGMADVTQSVSITENTVFRTASVTKPFAALAIMQLVERGLLFLDDSVRTWLPELPVSWHEITIHDLLTHQSGIPNYLSTFTVGVLDGMTNQDVLDYFTANATLDFLPATDARYSNGNYTILAEIIARASGQSFAQYLHANILTPAGMTSSYLVGEALPLELDVALNYAYDLKANGITYLTTGAIGLMSSISDLNRFVVALLDNEIVSAAMFKLMVQPHAKFGDNRYYGYGWYVNSPFNGMFNHGGMVGGFRSMFYINRKENLVFITLGNEGELTDIVVGSSLNVIRYVYENITADKIKDGIRIKGDCSNFRKAARKQCSKLKNTDDVKVCLSQHEEPYDEYNY